MVMGDAHSRRRGAGAKARRPAMYLAIAALLIGLGACSPVETYRNLTGANKNDPNPQTTPNTKNLAAGEASAYPNLATVPPPPTRALTAAELDKLTKSLIADRDHAKYTSEKLQAGFAEASAPAPPPPPPAPAAAPKEAEAASSAGPAAISLPASAGPASAAPGSNQASGAASAPAASRHAAGAGAAASATTGAAKGPRKAGEPPEPGPMESSLRSPQIAALPNPQQSEPAPPPPRQLNRNGSPGTAHLPSPPPQAPMPTAMASARFEPPPPPPVLRPAAPTRAAAATGLGKSAATPPAEVPVAEINFPSGSTSLSDADRRGLGKIVQLYRRNPGKVRVVGYAGVGGAAVQQLNSFQAALDRAQAVAAALAKAGIPSEKILVEAAPAGIDSGQARAEIRFER